MGFRWCDLLTVPTPESLPSAQGVSQQHRQPLLTTDVDSFINECSAHHRAQLNPGRMEIKTLGPPTLFLYHDKVNSHKSF